MRDLEVLCRASAFLVKSNYPPDTEHSKERATHSHHLLTVSHAVAPWKWPKLYPDEWLQYVNEKHTHYTVELRHEDGIFVHQADLLSRPYLHANRDLAVLHLEDESQTIELYRRMGVECGDGRELIDAHSPYYPLGDGQKLQFHGHEVAEPLSDAFFDPTPAPAASAAADGTGVGTQATGSSPGLTSLMEDTSGGLGFGSIEEEDKKVIPRSFAGTVQGRTQNQIFVSTRPLLLPNGMCGGPVYLPTTAPTSLPIPAQAPSADAVSTATAASTPNESKPRSTSTSRRRGVPKTTVSGAGFDDSLLIATGSQHSSAKQQKQLVCGLLEGIVPTDHAVEELRGSAVFVEGPQILRFLQDIERGTVTPLEGGDAAAFIGQDQDPEKMDIRKIVT